MNKTSGTSSISYFIFCKNENAQIEKTICNILDQNIKNIEIVVQDGGSTDGTLKKLKKYRKHINLKSKPDHGPHQAFWRALKRCRNEYVGCLNCDEELFQDAILSNLEIIQASAAHAIYRDAELVDSANKKIGVSYGEKFDVMKYWGNQMCPNFSTALISRKALNEVGLHTFSWIDSCGEFEIWTRLGSFKKVIYKPGIVSKYMLRHNQLSNNAENILKLCLSRIYAKYRHITLSQNFQNLKFKLKKIRMSCITSFRDHAGNQGHSDVREILEHLLIVERNINNERIFENLYKSLFYQVKSNALDLQNLLFLIQKVEFRQKEKNQSIYFEFMKNNNLGEIKIKREIKSDKIIGNKAVLKKYGTEIKKFLNTQAQKGSYENTGILLSNYFGEKKINLFDVVNCNKIISHKEILLFKQNSLKNLHILKTMPKSFFYFSFLKNFQNFYFLPILKNYNTNITYAERVAFFEARKKISFFDHEYKKIIRVRNIIPTLSAFFNSYQNQKSTERIFQSISYFFEIIGNEIKKLFLKILKLKKVFSSKKHEDKAVIKASNRWSLQKALTEVINRDKYIRFLKSIQIKSCFSFNIFNEAITKCDWKSFTNSLRDNIAHLNTEQLEFVFQNELKNPFATNESIQKLASAFAQSIAIEKIQKNKFSEKDKKIAKIAFHCAFWDAPTCINQVLPWIQHAKDYGLEIILLGTSQNDISSPRDSISFYDTTHYAKHEFKKLLQEKKVDVFVDLNGLSPHHRLREMNLRFAPWQISYMNHTATLGIKNIDYIIADKFSLPKTDEQFYIEKILRIEKCFFCFDISYAKKYSCSIPPSLKKKYITFGCFGSAGKLNEQLIDLYCSVLQNIPKSKIVLQNNEFHNPVTKQSVEKMFSKRGFGSRRVQCRPGVSHLKTLECYKDIDISLDTFPYNGGNTIAESLNMGVPVLTLRGSRFSSRYGGSILNNSGCKDLCLDSKKKFVKKAKELSEDFDRLIYLRKNLRKMCFDNSFGNSLDFAQRFFLQLNALIKRNKINSEK